MKKLIVLVFLVFVLKIQYGQSFLEQGYILLSEQDTIYGLINNNNYYKNSLYCDFKKTDSEEVKRYFPKDIYGYRFKEGKYYVSRSLIIKGKDSLFFMEYLIDGELDIYFRQENKINKYYASKNDTILSELKHTKERTVIDGKPVIIENKQYVGLLNYFTTDYPKLKKEINKINEPKHKNLIKLSEKYHNYICKDGECIIYEKQLPRKVVLNTFGGFNYFPFWNLEDDEVKGNYHMGFNILFQQFEKNERFFSGIGFIYYSEQLETDLMGPFSIPLIFMYLHPKQGFSPVFSISWHIPFLARQSLGVGFKYKFNRMSIYTTAELNTLYFIIPGYLSQNLGVSIDLN